MEPAKNGKGKENTEEHKNETEEKLVVDIADNDYIDAVEETNSISTDTLLWVHLIL
ncbi:hypothetical protein TRIUR3_19572 [Triticum urartu]|uniref:Uncharacterized protein n=1 Tax=Triticum urartu TaxID=4572 RepID=M8ARH2_TRIUA|nr:hypothetical protein TRIUR3_19572 [Triticum urartu]